MDHSVTARYAAPPAAHFPRRPARVRGRHLGLRSVQGFQAAAPHATVLHEEGGSAVARLKAGGRALRIVAPRRRASGAPRPAVAMRWSRVGRPGPARPSGAAASPWHA